MRVFISVDGPLLDIRRFCDLHEVYSKEIRVIAKNLHNWAPNPEAILALAQLSPRYEIWIVIPCFYAAGLVEVVKEWSHRHLPALAHQIICTPDYGVIGQQGDVLIATELCDRFPGTSLEYSKDFGWAACLSFIRALSAPIADKRGVLQEFLDENIARVDSNEITHKEFFTLVKSSINSLREVVAKIKVVK